MTRTLQRQILGVSAGLASTALFGFSAPVSKLLPPSADPWTLAALLYRCAGLERAIIRALRPMRSGPDATPPPDLLLRADLPLVAAITILGGGSDWS